MIIIDNCDIKGYTYKYSINKKDSFTYYVLDVDSSGSTSTPNTTVKPIATTK